MTGAVGLAWVNKWLLVGKSLPPREDERRANEHSKPKNITELKIETTIF
jgi:hypothetical protein